MSEKHGILVRFQGLPHFLTPPLTLILLEVLMLVNGKKRASVKLARMLAICRER